MSAIKRFRVYLNPKTSEDLSEEHWMRAEQEMLRQFDEWRTITTTILSVNFGRMTGSSLDPYECPHFVYMTILVG
ncbi:hypothetical protein HY480_02630 [Candidatus Uhrbacteria bacterium]|nr:hypothetical protein [Candidatus Uhrbacteria bacterium]